MSDPGDLDDIASALYSGPPEEFTASRNARAKEADDRDLAERIRSLRKPTVAAWVVNLFSRERSARLGQALQLAAELREAQEDLDAPTLSELGRQRRTLTNQLATEAGSLASSHGARVTGATLEAVRQTISAAFFDQDAAAAVASGRLVHDLEPTGSYDLDAMVGGGRPAAPTSPAPSGDELSARRTRRDAERAVREAKQTRDRAARSAQRAQQESRDAQELLDRLTSRIAELEAELQLARARVATAEQDAEDARDREVQASDDAAEAERGLERARHAL
ncbi:transposase [Microbacterium sp. Mu-80]|uniref:Transposase n=1 Tax=Microbacterium bandirmense TaxID=3122050 RepID=A0ABU8LCB6_9MICO